MTHLQELRSYAENEGADPKKLGNYQDILDWVKEHIKDPKIRNENPAQYDRMQKIVGDYNDIVQGIKKGTYSRDKSAKGDKEAMDEATGANIASNHKKKVEAEEDADELIRRKA